MKEFKPKTGNEIDAELKERFNGENKHEHRGALVAMHHYYLPLLEAYTTLQTELEQARELLQSSQDTANNYMSRCISDSVEIERLKFELAQAKAEREWISVSESLPVQRGNYLVLDINSPFEDKREIAEYAGYNKTWFQGTDVIHPTHWMPLPSAPKD